MLSNRCCNILLMLLKSRTSLKLKDIGAEFGISERATRYDLDSIDEFLLKYDFDVLSRKTNVGVGYVSSGENRKKLFSAILSEREGTVFDTPATRLMAILVNLILTDKFVTIDGEADRLMVSRSTVFKDFEKLRSLFNKNTDALASSVSGYILSGEEHYIRLLSSKVILSVIEARDIVEIITYSSDQDSLLAGSKLYKIFEDVPEESLRESLSRLVDFKRGNLRDNTFAFCAIALCVAFQRIHKKSEREIDYSKYSFTIEEVENIASPLFGDDKNARDFVALLLSYVEDLEASGDFRQTFPDIQLYAHNLINKISKFYNFDMLSSRLISVVSEELIDIIFDELRGKDKIAPTLDMGEDISLYELIKEELTLYENILKRKINDTDIARFFRIFYTEYQINVGSKSKKKVIVLCPFDRTYSLIVSEKIKSMFDVEVFESWGLKALESDIKKYGCDLIVSTLQVSVEDINAVKIGTNFGESEIGMLKEFLPNREIGVNVLKSIKNILSNHEIGQEETMKILKEISSELNISMEEMVKNDECHGIVAVEITEAEDYIDALKQAGEIMQNNGLILSGYTDEMIAELSESKTHMVVMESVVLAHSRKVKYVKQTGGVLLKLKNKVPFIKDGDEMCDLIFAISSTGVDAHFDMISEISETLIDEAKLKVLKESESESEILGMLGSNR